MGYYVNTEDINIIIPKDLLEPAYKAVLAMNENDEIKRGGSYGPNSERKFWFSWMPEDLSTLPDLKAVMLNLGFEDTDYNENGDLVLGHYNNKTGQEDLFLYFVAPYVQEMSYAIWKGEDNEFWKWEFNDGKMQVIPGEMEIIWNYSNAYTPMESFKRVQEMMSRISMEAAQKKVEESNA